MGHNAVQAARGQLRDEILQTFSLGELVQSESLR